VSRVTAKGVDHRACHCASSRIQRLSYSAAPLHTFPSEAVQLSPSVGACEKRSEGTVTFGSQLQFSILSTGKKNTADVTG